MIIALEGTEDGRRGAIYDMLTVFQQIKEILHSESKTCAAKNV
jgi:hypothetical protein